MHIECKKELVEFHVRRGARGLELVRLSECAKFAHFPLKRPNLSISHENP